MNSPFAEQRNALRAMTGPELLDDETELKQAFNQNQPHPC